MAVPDRRADQRGNPVRRRDVVGDGRDHGGRGHPGAERRELAVPTVFNFLGPVANPARPGTLAVGVADPRMGPVLAGVLAGRGNSALVFHGDDGLDELTTTTKSTVWVVHSGTVSQ